MLSFPDNLPSNLVSVKPTFASPHSLIVDDELDLRHGLWKNLTCEGYEIYGATDVIS